MCADAKIRHLSINKRCRIQPLILLCALFLPDNILFLLSSVMSIIPQQETSENYNGDFVRTQDSWIIPQQETSENYNCVLYLLFADTIIPQQETSENYNTSLAPLPMPYIIPQQETSENYNTNANQLFADVIIPQQETSENYNLEESKRQNEINYTTTRNIRELQRCR